jgi:hypothetical protein
MKDKTDKGKNNLKNIGINVTKNWYHPFILREAVEK